MVLSKHSKYQLYSVLLLLLLFLFQNCWMAQFILLKPLKSNFLQFLEEAGTSQCVESEVPRGLLLHTDQLMLLLKIRFESLEENELDNATIPEQQQDQENGGVHLILWEVRGAPRPSFQLLQRALQALLGTIGPSLVEDIIRLNCPKKVPKWFRNGPKVVPKWSQNGPKMVPKLSQNGPKLVPNWS